MSNRIDLNCDLGESWGVYSLGADAEMLSIVTSANIACGFHAGDFNTMRETVGTAVKNGCGIGAHPGYLDLWGFGRRKVAGDSPEELERQVAYQIGALQGIAALSGGTVTHVKCHGAFGNRIQEDDEIAMAVGRAIKSVDKNLIYLAMPGMATERAAQALDLRVAREIYADRAYQDNGNLVPRGTPGAMIHDAGEAAARILRIVETGRIPCLSGGEIEARVDSVCVHGDGPEAVATAAMIRDGLLASGVRLESFNSFV